MQQVQMEVGEQSPFEYDSPIAIGGNNEPLLLVITQHVGKSAGWVNEEGGITAVVPHRVSVTPVQRCGIVVATPGEHSDTAINGKDESIGEEESVTS
jgi:hypothetical protein|tara:strand:+ start:185 stop:475 length:291 start_codon:yes stop_codon:yes gene_type:complete